MVVCLFYILKGRQRKLGSYENRTLVHLEGSFNSAQIFDLSFSFLEPVSSSANGENVYRSEAGGAGGNALHGVDALNTTVALDFKICKLHWVVKRLGNSKFETSK